jgi:hypothetical protein
MKTCKLQSPAAIDYGSLIICKCKFGVPEISWQDMIVQVKLYSDEVGLYFLIFFWKMRNKKNPVNPVNPV